MKWLRACLFICNLFVAAGMLTAAIASTGAMAGRSAFQLAGLAFPLLLILNMLFILLWMALLDWLLVIPLFSLILHWELINATFSIPSRGEDVKNKGIKIMSWNVKNFDLYNWSGNADSRNRMLRLIQNENPDILCFQEYYTDNGRIFDNSRYFSDTMGYRHYCFLPTAMLDKFSRKRGGIVEQRWGLAVFSRFPMTNHGALPFSNSKHNSLMYADLLIGSDTIRVFNTHLQSIHLGYEDYQAIERIEQEQSSDWAILRSIAGKLAVAFGKRSDQAMKVSTLIKQSPYPRIVCGDFNDTPASYAYRLISEGMKDPFTEFGKGFGSTYNGMLSLLRIDFILLPPAFSPLRYRVLREDLSDHYPVLLDFNMEAEQ
jgi:endonuclease/exonuclease/phosphatase family metal-dependent hydrolase